MLEQLLKTLFDTEISVENLNKEELEIIETVLKTAKQDLEKGCHEVLKTDANGQWVLHKAPKEPRTLDYSKMNEKPDYASIEANAPTLDYSKLKDSTIKPADRTIDYKPAPIKKPSTTKKPGYKPGFRNF